MSIRELRHQLERAADKGRIKPERIIPITLTMIGEAAAQAFHAAYFGQTLEKEIESVRAMRHKGENILMGHLEAYMTDLTRVRRVHTETHTSSDFPIALAQARITSTRPTYQLPDSNFLAFAVRRTANDFKQLKSNRFDQLSHSILPRRPEGTNIESASFGTSEDGYSIASYGLKLDFTKQAWYNDDIGEFTQGASQLGVVARRTRSWTIIDVIRTGAFRLALPNGEFGPTPENVELVEQYLASRTLADGRRTPRELTDIFVPTDWKTTARRTLTSERMVVTGGGGTVVQLPDANPAFDAATSHIEPMLAEFAGDYAGHHAKDWVAMDARSKPIEFAALRGYEGGPRTFVRAPETVEDDDGASYETGTLSLKVEDHHAAFLADAQSVLIASAD